MHHIIINLVAPRISNIFFAVAGGLLQWIKAETVKIIFRMCYVRNTMSFQQDYSGWKNKRLTSEIPLWV